MVIKLNKCDWRIYLAVVFFVLAYITPAGMNSLPIFNTVASIYKMVFPLILFYLNFGYVTVRVEKVDLVVLLIVTLYIVSAIFNHWYRINTLNRAARIFAFYFMMRLACLNANQVIRKTIFIALADTFCVLSIINFISVVVHIVTKGFSESLVFFWTDDNKSIEYYLIAIFFAYIKKIYINKDSVLIYILYLIVPIHTILLHVGMGVIISIILYVYFFLYFIKGIEKALSLNYVLIFFLLLGMLIFLYFQNGLIEPLVNFFFENKYHNLNSRIRLWHYFINRTLKTPLYGLGVLTDQISTRKHGFEYWILIGNVHNLFIEATYQAGILNILSAVYLIFTTLSRVNVAEKRHKFIGVFLIIFLVEGMMELGYATLFLFIPTLYYLNNETLKYKEVRTSA